MGIDLALWLTKQRSSLLPRWATALQLSAAIPTNGHQAASIDSNGIGLDEGSTATLGQIYEGLILAADGDRTGLDEKLQQLIHDDIQPRTHLPDLLTMASHLRRLACESLQQDVPNPVLFFTLFNQLEALVDDTTAVLTHAWIEQTNELIRETEFIAESLDAASAAADRQALQLKALNEISQSLSASLESDQVLHLVGSSLMDLLGVTHIAIWLPDTHNIEEAASSMLYAALTWGNEMQPVQGLTLVGPSTDLVLRAYECGDVIFEPNPNPELLGLWHQPQCGVLALPLLVKEHSIGVVVLQDPNPVEQLRLQQDLAQGIVNQTAIALQNARLYDEVRSLNTELEQRVIARTHELQEEKDRLSTIHEISSEVSSTLDLDSLLETSLEALARITQAEHGSILLMDRETEHLVNRATLGTSDPNQLTRFPIGKGVAGWVAQNKKPSLIDDVNEEKLWISIEGSQRKRTGAMVVVPLIVQNEVLGVLTLSHAQVGYFNEGHLRLLTASAGAIAVGINNANLYATIVAEMERNSTLLARQQLEASQTAAILQSLSDGVVVCDMYGSVLSTNPAASQILGHSVEEIFLSNLHDLLRRYLGQRAELMPLNELLTRPIGHNQQPRRFESTVQIDRKVVSMTLGPVLKEDGELLGALLLLRDITREVEADRLKTEFIGTMSHELRTPMTAIKGFTQLLAMGSLGPLNDTQREFVSTIHSNTERMINLINDVLDITKIESGSIELELRPLHLAEALSGVMAELQSLSEERRHNITVSIPPGLPLVRADAHRLHQILYNLISNAIKYTPREGQVWIEAREATLVDLPEHVRDGILAGRRYTQMDIRDTGVGIEAHELERVFERFYRTENPLKIEAGGTGLGLSLVKPLIGLLGGRIWAQSTLNEGSTFSFILPAA
jgi:PAS domain S-box-containing protein